ncbi:unnamed protein product, partial [Ectocarpus sp. 12 AP-2014]
GFGVGLVRLWKRCAIKGLFRFRFRTPCTTFASGSRRVQLSRPRCLRCSRRSTPHASPPPLRPGVCHRGWVFVVCQRRCKSRRSLREFDNQVTPFFSFVIFFAVTTMVVE